MIVTGAKGLAAMRTLEVPMNASNFTADIRCDRRKPTQIRKIDPYRTCSAPKSGPSKLQLADVVETPREVLILNSKQSARRPFRQPRQQRRSKARASHSSAAAFQSEH